MIERLERGHLGGLMPVHVLALEVAAHRRRQAENCSQEQRAFEGALRKYRMPALQQIPRTYAHDEERAQNECADPHVHDPLHAGGVEYEGPEVRDLRSKDRLTV